MNKNSSNLDSILSKIKAWRLDSQNRGSVPEFEWLQTVYDDGYMSGTGITALAEAIGCGRDTLLRWLKDSSFEIYRYPEWLKIVYGQTNETTPEWESILKKADVKMRIRRHNVAVVQGKTGAAAADIASRMMERGDCNGY